MTLRQAINAMAVAILPALSPSVSAQLEEVDFLLEFEAERGRSAARSAEPFSQPGAPAAGERRTFSGIDFVFIPGGLYDRGGGRGGSNAGPRHRVTLTTGFWLSRFETTQSQWMRIMNTAPWRGKPHAPEGPDRPATHISYDDALAFAAALNASGAGEYRLPTEAEWERACRAGSETLFAFGNDDGEITSHGWTSVSTVDIGQSNPRDVGQLTANAWGLHDMHGNVMEWCADWYEAYGRRSLVDPQGPDTGSVRVARGGSWLNLPQQTTSAHRTAFLPAARTSFIGFRLAKQLQPSELKLEVPER